MLVNARRRKRLIHVPGKATIDRVVADLRSRVREGERIQHRHNAFIGRRVIDDDSAKRRVNVRRSQRRKAALNAGKTVVNGHTDQHAHGINFALQCSLQKVYRR